MRRHALTAALTIALAGLACAQDATNDEDVLGGPSVTSGETGDAPTIVRRSFDGTLERPEGMPEVAALEALTLDEASRKAVDDALAERHAMIDGILAENLDLFSRVIQAFQARGGVGRGQIDREGRREMMELFREVRPVVMPVVERGSLREEIALALDGDAKTHFEHMLDEFDEAVRADRGGGMGMDGPRERPQRERGERGERGPQGERPERGPREGRGEGRGGEMRAVLGVVREFGSSYERVIGQRVEDYNQMLDSLDVSSETRAKIEAAFQGSLSEDYDSDEERQRARSARMQEVLRSLEPEERRRVIEQLRAVRGPRDGR